MTGTRSAVCSFLLVASCAAAHAVPIYLNDSNMTVTLGPNMAPDPFANLSTAASLANVIDAPSAAAPELHNQSTHVWVSGGILELFFDFGVEYDLTAFHFWNYHSEGFDVDNIDLTFFNDSMNVVGTLPGISPALGNPTGSDGTAIFAEDFALAFPQQVQFVLAVLSGSNNQVDFNNIGFTGELSDTNGVLIPEPASAVLMACGVAFIVAMRKRRSV